MTDALDRLLDRARGAPPTLAPSIRPRFAPYDTPLFEVEREGTTPEDAPGSHRPAGPENQPNTAVPAPVSSPASDRTRTSRPSPGTVPSTRPPSPSMASTPAAAAVAPMVGAPTVTQDRPAPLHPADGAIRRDESAVPARRRLESWTPPTVATAVPPLEAAPEGRTMAATHDDDPPPAPRSTAAPEPLRAVPAPPSAPRPGAPVRPESAPVRVSIGRIELRATPTTRPAPAPEVTRRPGLSLDSYLRERTR